MQRTQIYFPEDQYRWLKNQAFEREITISELIRQAVTKLKKATKTNTRVKQKDINHLGSPGEWLQMLAHEAEEHNIEGPKDLASKVDEYLYGK